MEIATTPRIAHLRGQTVAASAAITAAVALPQMLHWIGGPALGQSWLPMHLPVMLVGLVAGPVVGLTVGAVSPLISFGLSGMPAAGLLPFMVVELGVYGLVAGLLAGRAMPVAVKVLGVQVVGRTARLIAVLGAVLCLKDQAPEINTVWQATLAGWPGILLQLCLVPLAIQVTKRRP